MSRRAAPTCAVSLLGACLAAAAQARAAALQFIEGDFGDGYVFVTPFDVSGDGSVVVGAVSRTSDNGSRAFRWTAAGGLENLGLTAGWTSSSANAVSRDGRVIGVDQWTGSVARTGSALWTRDAGLVPLAPPPGGIGDSRAPRSNADGSVVTGTWIYDDAYHDRAYRWTTAGGAVGLPLPDGYNYSFPAAMSDDGSVVVGTVGGAEPAVQRTAIWDGATVRHVPGTEGMEGSATATSADGSIVAGSAGPDGSGSPQLFRWSRSGRLEWLGNPATGGFAHALDVSGDGSVIVGGVGNRGGDDDGSFVWDAEHGMRTLTEVLNAAGVDTTGVSSFSIWGTSTDGRTFVGTAVDHGELKGFVAVVPEPAGAAILMVLGAGGLLRRRGRAPA